MTRSTDMLDVSRHKRPLEESFWAADTRSPEGLLRGERGMMSLVNVVAVLFCTILMSLVTNAGHTIQRKIEAQNTADAVAYSSAVWQARGMNAITATNHVMGEMLAFVVIHEAIGGKKLDENRVSSTSREDTRLDIAHAFAVGLGARDFAYDTVRERRRVHAEATLLDAKKQLKNVLAGVYTAKFFAKIAQMSIFPPTVAAGFIAEIAADFLELKILSEYVILNGLDLAARALIPVKRMLRDVLLPAAKRYTSLVRIGMPAIVAQTPAAVASLNDATGALFPRIPTLPVQIDPLARTSQAGTRSQLTRAAFPWVNYHRQPLLKFMRAFLTLSGAEGDYFRWTNFYTRTLSAQLQRDRDLGQYVMTGYERRAPRKGFEFWTNDSVSADQVFTLVGFAHTEAPTVASSPTVYQQANPDGFVTFAQAMYYNANPQVRGSSGGRQAAVGWDTLNWNGRPFEFTESRINGEFPDIRVNWQAKLVPTTTSRMAQAMNSGLPGEFRAVTRRMLQLIPLSMRTH